MTRSALADLTAPEPAFEQMSKLSSIPAGGETPPVPSLPKALITSEPSPAVTEGALIDAVWAAKRPLAASRGAVESSPP
jgi:hypothetical protein